MSKSTNDLTLKAYYNQLLQRKGPLDTSKILLMLRL